MGHRIPFLKHKNRRCSVTAVTGRSLLLVGRVSPEHAEQLLNKDTPTGGP